MKDALDGYLAAATRKIFDYSRHDCCQHLRGWIVLCGHPDPAADFPPYQGEREALLAVHRRGGLEALLTDLAATAGLSRTEACRRGDVGVVRVQGRVGLSFMGGIFTGRRWAVLSKAGLGFVTASPSRAWRV